MSKNKITVIGAGLAGSEAALTIADFGIDVDLIDCKPSQKSAAHSNDNFCELVCSNSLKSNDVTTAHGLLKAELRLLKSHVLDSAEKTAVPAGSALAVDRERFALDVTEKLKSNAHITIKNQLVTEIPDGVIVIATGPLTMPPLSNKISDLFGELHFFDAEAPIVSAESIDMNHAYFAARYGKGDDTDYLNCPLNKDEYEVFYNELISAQRAELHSFEKNEIFEGCMPVEVMAMRGKDAIRFGPMKPVGLRNPVTGERAYAVLQLRKENVAGDMFNLVGFQTNLKFAEQKRVFGLIPALKNAEFLRYGVMHRNTFIDAPKSIDCYFRAKNNANVFIAGQLSGVEGYVESIGSGKVVAIFAVNSLLNKELTPLPHETIIGALARYISTPNNDFQPMNANYGLLPVLEKQIKDKSEKRTVLAERSLCSLQKYQESINYGN